MSRYAVLMLSRRRNLVLHTELMLSILQDDFASPWDRSCLTQWRMSFQVRRLLVLQRKKL